MLLNNENRQVLVKVLSDSSGNDKAAKTLYTLIIKLIAQPDEKPEESKDILIKDRELLLVRDLFTQYKLQNKINPALIPTYELFMGVIEVED